VFLTGLLAVEDDALWVEDSIDLNMLRDLSILALTSTSVFLPCPLDCLVTVREDTDLRLPVELEEVGPFLVMGDPLVVLLPEECFCVTVEVTLEVLLVLLLVVSRPPSLKP